MVGLAGRVADGVILNLCPVEAVGRRLQHLREAAARRSPGLPEPEVACVIPCCVSDDAELALAAARDVVLDYMLHPTPRRPLRRGRRPGAGLGGAGPPGRRPPGGGGRHGPRRAGGQVRGPGPPHACAEQVARYRAAGVDTPIVFPRPVGPPVGRRRSGSWRPRTAPAPRSAQRSPPARRTPPRPDRPVPTEHALEAAP